MINEQEFRKLKDRVETLRLSTLDPVLREWLGRIKPDSNNPAHEILWRQCQQRFAALAGEYDVTGIVNVPPSFLPGGFPVGFQEKTGAILNVSDGGNSIFAGPPSSGKTTLKHLTVLAVKYRGKRVVLLDPKDDDRFLTTIFPMVTIDETYKKNLLERPPWLSVKQFIGEVIDWFRMCFYGGEAQGAVLRRALEIAFEAKPNPSWKDVHAVVDALGAPKGLFGWREACLWLGERLHKVRYRYEAAYASNEPGYIADLSGDVYLPMRSMDQVGEWLGIVSLSHIFQRNKDAKNTSITTIGFIDESIGMVHKDEHGRIGPNPITTLITRCREYGPHLHMTAVNLTQLDPLLLSSVATIALLPGLSEQSLRLVGLTPLQANTARHLRLSQVMLLFPGRLPWPVMAGFNPLPPGLKERRPAPKLVAPTPPLILGLGELRAPDGRPIMVVVTSGSSNGEVFDGIGDETETDEDLPSPEPPPAPRPPGEAVLDPLEEAYLRHVEKEVVATTKATNDALDLHPDRGNRIKSKLIGLGYVVAGKLTTHGGRGGGSASGMMLTSAGFRRIGVTPPTRSVGTGIQGAWTCNQFLKLIPNSRLEVDIAGKRADLIARIDFKLHRSLVDALNAQSLSWLNREYDLPDGSLLALEIETGDESNVVRSVRSNLEKNRAAGLAFIVFAVMPSQFARVLPVIRADGDEKLLVVDAIKLLDALRAGPTVVSNQEGK